MRGVIGGTFVPYVVETPSVENIFSCGRFIRNLLCVCCVILLEHG